MGHRLYVEVLDHAPSTLTHRERLLLAVLAEDALDETRTTWSRVEDPKILRRADVSRSGLYASLKALTAKGVLEKVTAGQKNAAAKYRVAVLAPAQCPEFPDTDPTSQCPGNPDTDAPQRPGIQDTDTAAQCPESPDTETGRTPQCPENPDTEPVSVSRNPGPLNTESVNTHPPAPPTPEGFDDFWAAYPRRVAKGAARNAWARALKRGADPAAITAAATRHAAQWRAAHTEPRFIPYPATWLNSERYDDETDPTPPATQPPLPGATPSRYTDPAERGIF
ncbi:hypothetical protein [Streptomyces sp. CC224B]|uniref:hypothetical protein n=1 Tax=Streptomyces sp. CC224B TaxID=3044571 RepID=UPI0024A8DF2B|nr:hypothetical protein [Streptomyces sp. CC224B]